MRSYLLLLLLVASSSGWALGPISPGKVVGSIAGKVKNGTRKGVEVAKNATEKGVEVANDVAELIPSPSKVLDEIIVSVPDPAEIAKNVSELVKTMGVFVRNNESLNCFGLPVKLVDKALEKIFMQSTTAKDVRFYFFNRRSPHNITYHAEENFDLQQLGFDVMKPTVVVVHGFMSSGQEAWMGRMKDAFLRLDDANAIIVDWQKGSNTWNYYSAAISTRVVGLQIAKLFAKIREQAVALRGGVDQARISEWGTIYMVGHSLGSHISAHASYLIRESQKRQTESWIVGRITGLDPAQPCFSIADPSLKLDKDDAPFVDVIHTNARNLLFLGLGLPEQLGFVDFYPNGGKAQPGCSDINASFWSFLLLPINLIEESMCSHGRSHAFLTESAINLAAENCTFFGYQWDRKNQDEEAKALKETCVNDACTTMGVASSNYSGIFFVPTKPEAPYCAVNEDTRQLLKSAPYEKNIFARIPKKYPTSRS